MSTVKGVWKFRPHVMPMEGEGEHTEYVKFKWFPNEWPEYTKDVNVASVEYYYYEDDFSKFEFSRTGQISGWRKVARKYYSGTTGTQTTYPTNTYRSGHYIRYVSSNGLCWRNGSFSEPMYLDFGETEQEVSDRFYEWLTSNAVEQIPVECSHNGVTTLLDRGHISTLTCEEKYAIDDIKIKGSPLTSWFEYNGKRNYIGNGETILLPCTGKKMRSDIVINTIKEYPDELYTYNVNLVESQTYLKSEIKCSVGDLIVAAITTRDAFTVSDGWTLISTSEAHNEGVADNIAQKLSWAYKVAENSTESITVTQASAQRLYINLVALQGATGVIDNGYLYAENGVNNLTATKPVGNVLWGLSSVYWDASTTTLRGVWTISNNSPIIQVGGLPQSRLGLALDQSDDETVTFTGSEKDSHAIIVGCLTVQGMEKFY